TPRSPPAPSKALFERTRQARRRTLRFRCRYRRARAARRSPWQVSLSSPLPPADRPQALAGSLNILFAPQTIVNGARLGAREGLRHGQRHQPRTRSRARTFGRGKRGSAPLPRKGGVTLSSRSFEIS